jgi:hypothetical protein
MLLKFAYDTYGISCADIGNCSAKTPTIGSGFSNIVNILLILVGALAVIFVIISGVQMVFSAGNAKRFQQARESLIYSAVGVGLAIAAYGIVAFVAKNV